MKVASFFNPHAVVLMRIQDSDWKTQSVPDDPHRFDEI